MSVIVGRDVGTYVFDASAQTITISGVSSLTIQDIDLITNQTDGIIIYNFASPSEKGVLSGGILTLDYDTTSMDDGDEIQIRLGKNYAIDYDLNQQNVGVQNPEWAHYTSSETLLAETNLAVNTYFYEVTGEAYRNGIFHVGGNTSGSGVVWKVYGALDESRTVPSAGGTPGSERADIGQELMNASSITTTTRQKAIIRDTAVMYPYYLFEYTIDNATNTPTLLQNKY